MWLKTTREALVSAALVPASYTIIDMPDAAFLEKCSVVGTIVFANQKEWLMIMEEIRTDESPESPEECARRAVYEKGGLPSGAIHSMQLLFGFSGKAEGESAGGSAAGSTSGSASGNAAENTNMVYGVCFSVLADLEMAEVPAAIKEDNEAAAEGRDETTAADQGEFAAFWRSMALKRAFRIPRWNKAFSPSAHGSAITRRVLQQEQLHTVCSSAVCPNRGECHAHGTATFLILGNSCTRNCRFCAIDHGHPEPLDPSEPQRLAQAAHALGLRHIVITSVTRDDLPDGGASHFAACIHEIRKVLPLATVEVLPSDLAGNMKALEVILQAKPDVFNHNIETVPRLYKTVRPGADYRRSLNVLRYAREHGQGCHVKSGMMVGLGETPGEVRQALSDLKEAGCDMVTIGQYLRPTLGHLPVSEFVSPARFEYYEKVGHAIGLRWVFAGPLVRSSYRAAEALTGATAPAQRLNSKAEQ
jgi:lipoic acid synthetase